MPVAFINGKRVIKVAPAPLVAHPATAAIARSVVVDSDRRYLAVMFKANKRVKLTGSVSGVGVSKGAPMVALENVRTQSGVFVAHHIRVYFSHDMGDFEFIDENNIGTAFDFEGSAYRYQRGYGKDTVDYSVGKIDNVKTSARQPLVKRTVNACADNWRGYDRA